MFYYLLVLFDSEKKKSEVDGAAKKIFGEKI